MPCLHKFKSERSRGIVWVCDIKGSSNYLNNNKLISKLEKFLPRLYWTSLIIINAAGGKFIKWTGDGFLAWFETPLYREVGNRAATVFEAIWHLTFLVNVTQLGLSPEKRFHIRHGVCYEHDALITRVNHYGKQEFVDIVGRAVVLAFRLSGVDAPFPNILTQRELVESYRDACDPIVCFRKWSPSKDEIKQYFKNEQWGTKMLFASGNKRLHKRNISSIVLHGEKAISAAEGKHIANYPKTQFVQCFYEQFLGGPEWCKTVFQKHTQFIEKELKETLKRSITLLKCACE